MADPKQTAHTPHLAEKFDLPHSEAGHNPYWCGGDNHMTQETCWGCINFFLAAHDKLMEALTYYAKNPFLTEQQRAPAEAALRTAKGK